MCYRLSHDVVIWNVDRDDYTATDYKAPFISRRSAAIGRYLSSHCSIIPSLHRGNRETYAGKPMQERIKEHDRGIRLARTQTSAFSERAFKTDHDPI